MRVLVTGSNGFVGSALTQALKDAGHEVVAAIRGAAVKPGELSVGEIDGATDWREALHDVDAVVHLAARVHDVNMQGIDELAEYRKTNTQGTLNLARQAQHAGVKRFIFMSSIKVHGEGRAGAYRESDAPMPQDAYGQSKWEAEQGLMQQQNMEIVILRPPLIYGPHAGANFRRLMAIVAKGWPLPFGAIRNKRSLIYIDNLVDAVRVCLAHPEAPGKTFLLSDGAPISSAALMRALASAMHRPCRLVRVPAIMLQLAGMMIGKGQDMRRLTGSLHADDSAIRASLGWQPPFEMAQAMARTAQNFRSAA